MKLIGQLRLGRALVFISLACLLFILVAVTILHEPDPQTSEWLSPQAFKDIQLQQFREYTTSNNSRLKIQKTEFVSKERNVPSLHYEKLRRKIKIGIDELWYFISTQIKLARKQAQKNSTQLNHILNKILVEGAEHKLSLIKDMKLLKEADDHDRWRAKESAELSDLIQRRLHKLQNPKDCTKAKKLLCHINQDCGYGCQLHHVAYCFIIAYSTKRTMIMQSKDWGYHTAGWEDVYKAISNTCTNSAGETFSKWPGTANTQIVQLESINSIRPRPTYLPQAIPKDIAPRLLKLHGNPFVWWIGQFYKYLLKPQLSTKNMLDNAADSFGFKKPIVGVHIRRTDKVGIEADFHYTDEYMEKVEAYYQQLALSQDIPIKRVYIATDDPKVFEDVQRKYPEYQVIGNPNISKSAAVETRNSNESIYGVIIDTYFLSLSDFLVCTFSSHICRFAYEIMQSMHIDASDRFTSLDDIYYFGGQNTHRQVAVMSHKAKRQNQIDIKVGDNIAVFGNHWDGYSLGKNLRTNQAGLYPSFKVEELVELDDFSAHNITYIT